MSKAIDLEAQARWLHDARSERVAVRQRAETELTLADAYQVQQKGMALREAAGESRCGAKMGFTSRAKMAQMGVQEMILGQLTGAMQITDGGTFDRASAIHPRVEPEVAFLLGRDLDDRLSPARLIGAVDAVACAMEVIDSRYAEFRFSLPDVVADNTSACAFVLGPWQRVGSALDNRGMTLSVVGRVRQTGTSSAILGNPWRALEAAWRLACRYGIPIPAGSVLLAGAATAAEPLPEKGFVETEMSGFGRVSFHLE